MTTTAEGAAPVAEVRKAQSGVMVAFRPSLDVANQMALPGGLEPRDLHITLCYLGDAGDLDEEQYKALLREVQALSARTPPIEAKVSGVGRFAAQSTSGGLDAFYASVDSPGMADFRQQLYSMLVYGPGLPVSDVHGFTPHMTLKYLQPDEAAPVEHVPLMPMSFDVVEVHAGDRIEGFRLLGVPFEKSNDRADILRRSFLEKAAVRWDEDWKNFISLSSQPLTFTVLKRCDGVPRLKLCFDSPRAAQKSAWCFLMSSPTPPVSKGYLPCHFAGQIPQYRMHGVGKEGAADYEELIAKGVFRLTLASENRVELMLKSLDPAYNGRYSFVRKDGRWRVEVDIDASPMLVAKTREEVAELLSKEGSQTVIMPRDAMAFDKGYVKLPLPDYSQPRVGVRVLKMADEKRYTLGIAYPVGEQDAHGDFMDADEIERAAWSFIENRRIGLMHRFGTDGRGRVVESYVSRHDFEIGGQKVKAGDWLLGVVWDEEAWDAVKKGQITGYSMQGWAEREESD